MYIYNIKDSYISYLREFDQLVLENKRESRPYVGIVFEINNMKYYVPFTSPKLKHTRMRNGKDFRKIANGVYGAINFNNMIPVPDNALVLKDIENEPNIQYKNLLINQFESIKEEEDIIKSTAERLHTLIFTPDDELTRNDRKIKARCCNLSLLERVYSEWIDA